MIRRSSRPLTAGSPEILARFERAGIDVEALDAELQREGAKSFVDSWNALMAGLATKSETLKKAG